ncbi:MAG: hypothetical protein M1829_004131 [Trizodia sp. TS-e1964]|nr:MAG: hypothetical protein M1829_004131 [Trizodia sp. TS-e1964]
MAAPASSSALALPISHHTDAILFKRKPGIRAWFEKTFSKPAETPQTNPTPSAKPSTTIVMNAPKTQAQPPVMLCSAETIGQPLAAPLALSRVRDSSRALNPVKIAGSDIIPMFKETENRINMVIADLERTLPWVLTLKKGEVTPQDVADMIIRAITGAAKGAQETEYEFHMLQEQVELQLQLNPS